MLDASTVFIEAKVPEVDAHRLGAAKHATLELSGERGRFLPVTGEGGGRLVFTGLQVDPATRTVPMVYELKNVAGQFRIGGAVTLHFAGFYDPTLFQLGSDGHGGTLVIYL